tara:strand:+ start:7358 stop:8638 length:1281 start_codon:yes stop_codon:yes gene_type:complete
MHKLIKLLCLLLWANVSVAKVEPLDRVAAIVNDKVITRSQLKQQTGMFAQNLMSQGQSIDDEEALTKQVLEHLIVQEAQLQIAERSGIHVDDGMLTQVIQNFAKENKMTMGQFIDQLKSEGIEYEAYRRTIRDQLTLQQLQQRDIYGAIQVSEQEIQQFLNSPSGLGGMSYEYRIGHILVPTPENPTPEALDLAEQKAYEAITELKQGSEFAKVAMKTSTSALALQGGDLGWRKLGEMPTLFVNIVPGLKPNDIPAPIKSTSGFHVIQLLDKRQPDTLEMPITKYNVRHILVQTNDYISDNEAKTKLSVIKKQIQAGENFEALAKTHSNDLGSSAKGGNLGWVTSDALVKEFVDVMETTKVGTISEPFHSPFGWHILELVDKKVENDSDNALKQKARQMIHQRKFEERLQAWQMQLRDEAYVKTYL